MTSQNPGEFARSVQYQATLDILGQGLTEASLLSLAEGALALTTKMVAAIQSQSPPLACQPGCDACCYLMATVSGPEALSIARHMESAFLPAELKQLRARVKWAYRQTRTMDNLARARARIACPFLQEGRCAIYAYRPLDCVTYHSLSRQACQDVLARPGQETPPTDPTLQAVGVGIKTGLGQAMAEANLEHPAFRYELIEALHICLTDKHAMDKYLAGDNIFKPAAIIIDPHSRATYKIKHAPPYLQAYARKVIVRERAHARRQTR
jgi:Fe-S-cluster containining protein